MAGEPDGGTVLSSPLRQDVAEAVESNAGGLTPYTLPGLCIGPTRHAVWVCSGLTEDVAAGPENGTKGPEGTKGPKGRCTAEQTDGPLQKWADDHKALQGRTVGAEELLGEIESQRKGKVLP